MDQIKFWSDLWGHVSEKLKDKVRWAWKAIDFADEETAWKKGAGPLSATAITLMKLGWSSAGPYAVKSNDGEWWEFGKGKTYAWKLSSESRRQKICGCARASTMAVKDCKEEAI